MKKLILMSVLFPAVSLSMDIEDLNDNSLHEDPQDTPLHVACRAMNGDQIKLLIAHGARVNVQNKFNETPLHALIDSVTDNVDISALQALAKILIDQDHSIINVKDNVDGWTALHIASFLGKPPLVQLLLDEGAEDTGDEDGDTAFDLGNGGVRTVFAQHWGRQEIVAQPRIFFMDEDSEGSNYSDTSRNSEDDEYRISNSEGSELDVDNDLLDEEILRNILEDNQVS